jgi:hypothetical protein
MGCKSSKCDNNTYTITEKTFDSVYNKLTKCVATSINVKITNPQSKAMIEGVLHRINIADNTILVSIGEHQRLLIGKDYYNKIYYKINSMSHHIVFNIPVVITVLSHVI